MANTRITSSFITREFLSVLHSNLHVVKSIDHSWNKLFGKSIGPVGKSGPTVAIRKPALGVVRTGWQMDQNDITETSVNLTIDTPVGVDLNFSDADMALTIEDFSERYIVPNAMKLASYIDMSVASYIAKNTYNYVASSLTSSANVQDTFLAAAQVIKQNLVPMDSALNAIISPKTERTIIPQLAGQYNPQGNISEMYEKGQMAKAMGLDWYMSQVLPSLTHGTCTTGSSPAVSAVSGSTVTITNMTSGGTLTAGDIFTVSTVYAINPETKQVYGDLQQFVVTATTTASTTTLTCVVSPTPTWTSGASQNISATPVAGTVVLADTTSGQIRRQDLILHEKSFAIAFADLEQPKGMDMVGVESMDGISLRFVRGYDIANARFLSRMDAFYGVTALRPQWSCRIGS
jgi:hypothetical protein